MKFRTVPDHLQCMRTLHNSWNASIGDKTNKKHKSTPLSGFTMFFFMDGRKNLLEKLKHHACAFTFLERLYISPKI
ncbi:CLUMA_CG003519, isoform A [Clunio marinus]|uniref:CLUMA_CG003519, isoform A n=1 Tax=Clunio marinus TaxID=568069 RepID=A0A1J1HP41_9DIPT|nr:CLUMA_CG003519, isoform A [Clunio marinus]